MSRLRARRRVRRLWPALAVGACLAAGCSGHGGVKDEELEGLVVAPDDQPPPVDVDKAATDGRELTRALALPDRDVAALGSHRVHITSKVEVKEGAEVVDSLSDDTILEVAADGQFHGKLDNSADYGREIIFTGGELYLRPRYARWHRRLPTEPGEPAHLRDELYAVLGDYFDLVGHAAEVSDKGAATVAGRAGRKVEIKLAPSPGKPPRQALTQRKWRESVTVTALAGEAVLDADHGFPLSAHVTAELGFVRDGRSFTMALEVTHELADFGAAIAIAPPPADETVDTPMRLREVDERDALLEGIAPPAKASGGNAPTGRGPEPTQPPPPVDLEHQGRE
ncbi:MAG: hypothetical protein H6708_17290 [Kofleriaceae bacterium]|nr:hypothetical protein [Myxococcales bacterium]MCB9562162.1 hypothetical protein [Kofleriaceae bacterium]